MEKSPNITCQQRLFPHTKLIHLHIYVASVGQYITVQSKFFMTLNFAKSFKIGFLHFIYSRNTGGYNDQKITLNMEKQSVQD